MKFGNRLLRQADKSIASHYVDYRSLKQELKKITTAGDLEGKPWDNMLDQELQKVNKFYLEKEEAVEAQLKHFEDNPEQLATSSEFKEFCRFLEVLRYYVILCYMSIYKITKKRNKMLKTAKPIDYLTVVMNQPFYNSLRLARVAVKTELLALKVIPGNLNEQDFACPICLDVLCNPVILSCTHRFCWSCLSQTSARMQSCPLCRKEQNLDPSNFHIDWILTEFLQQKFPQTRDEKVQTTDREGLIAKLEKRACSLECAHSDCESPPAEAPASMPDTTEPKVQECKYSLLKRIGEGVFGEVYMAKLKDNSNDKQFALKKLAKNHPKFRQMSVFREVNAGRMVDHQGIIHFEETFETPSSIYLVMEYFPGYDLYTTLEERNYKPYSEATTKEIFKQLVAAVMHCHFRGIVHRDIKLENILLDKYGNTKLIDFGLCDFVMDVGNKIRLCADSVGSPAYISPEILTGKPYNGFKADVWSCGVVLYALLFGCFPFSPAQYKLLVSGEPLVVQFPESIVSKCVKDLLKSMLKLQPESRFSLEDVQAHDWMCDSIVTTDLVI
jgi:tRNA A-37 threonylcarbamoyl transferase component Bud32